MEQTLRRYEQTALAEAEQRFGPEAVGVFVVVVVVIIVSLTEGIWGEVGEGFEVIFCTIYLNLIYFLL